MILSIQVLNLHNETVEVMPHQGCTMILLRGADRPGFQLYEAITHHVFHVVNADLWTQITHKHHAAAIL